MGNKGPSPHLTTPRGGLSKAPRPPRPAHLRRSDAEHFSGFVLRKLGPASVLSLGRARRGVISAASTEGGPWASSGAGAYRRPAPHARRPSPTTVEARSGAAFAGARCG